MVVVGMLVGTFEPARVMVAIAQTASASAMANTAPPTQPAGAAAGMNGKGMSHCKASAASTASAHAIGGRMMTLAVSAVSLMARLLNRHSWRCKRFELLAGVLEHLRDDAAHGRIGQRSGRVKARAAGATQPSGRVPRHPDLLGRGQAILQPGENQESDAWSSPSGIRR